MKISLITICWNSERALKRTLDSVMEQTRRPDEYVFVDGGSIVLRKYESNCHFCGSSTGLSSYKGKLICKRCLSELKSL